MTNKKIIYPEEINEYVQLLKDETIYSPYTVECALKNCYKQVLKQGFSSIDDFHDYLQSLNPKNNNEMKDYSKYIDAEINISKKSNPSVFNKLMQLLTEKKNNLS